MTKDGRPVPKPGKSHLWRQLLKAIFTVLVAVLFTYALIHTGLLPDFELKALDIQTRINRPSEHSSQIVIVRITEEDYQTLFQGKSPLQPGRVHKIIAAIAKGQPKVIGVDIETDAPDYLKLEIPQDWPSVIWARTAKEEEPGKLSPLPVLGGREPLPCSGLVNILPDRDRVIRHYRRKFEEQDLFRPDACKGSDAETKEVEDDQKKCIPHGCSLPSFSWAIMRAFLAPEDFKRLKAGRSETEELAIRYARPLSESPDQPSYYTDVEAHEVLEVAAEDSQKSLNQLRQLFENKIVLLGGEYSAARDEHFTPLGDMTGVEITAQILETEMEGGGTPPPHWYVIALILLFEYILLAIIFHHFEEHFYIACGVSLLVIALMALLCSILAFGKLTFWIYFTPILIIGLIRELYDRAQEGRKKRIGWWLDYLRGVPQAPEHNAKASHQSIERPIIQSDKIKQIARKPDVKSNGLEHVSSQQTYSTIIAAIFVAVTLILLWAGSTQAKSDDKD